MPTLQHFIDASIAVAIMLALSVIARFLVYGVTDDGSAIAVVTATVVLLMGAVLLLRLWLSSSSAVTPKEPGTR